jgi:hypothetical protein
MSKEDTKIVEQILANAKKLKICGRYRMALERVLESIKTGSSKFAIKEQEEFTQERAMRRREKQKKRKNK